MRRRFCLFLLVAFSPCAARAQWQSLSIPYTVVFGGQTITTELGAFTFGTLGGKLVVAANTRNPADTRFPLGLGTWNEATMQWTATVGPRYNTPQFPSGQFDATDLDGPVRTSRGVFLGGEGAGLYRTLDEGATYTRLTEAQGMARTYPEVGSGAGNRSRTKLVAEAGGALWVTAWDGLYRSTDGGATWAKVTTGLPPFKNSIGASFTGWDDAIVHAVVEDGGALWAPIARGVSSTKTRGGLYKSTDGGTSWARVSGGLPDSADVYTFFRAGNRVLASTNLNTAQTGSGYNYTLYASSDGGATWTPAAFPLTTGIGGCPLRFKKIGDSVVAGCRGPVRPESGGLWVSKDQGTTWTDVSAGLPHYSRGGITVADFMAFGTDLYVIQNTDGVTDKSVWRRPLADLNITATAAEAAQAASGLRFDAPAPNPSLGAVTLRFALAVPGPARLAVYDALGREVAVLHDGAAGGEETVTFAAHLLAPGAYVVRLTAATGTATQRLVVIR